MVQELAEATQLNPETRLVAVTKMVQMQNSFPGRRKYWKMVHKDCVA
jgi:hypothetical protein